MTALYLYLKNKLNDTDLENELGVFSPNAITMIHIPN